MNGTVHTRRTAVTLASLAPLAAAGVVLVACGSSGSNGASSTGPSSAASPGAGSASTATAGGTAVMVSEDEFHLMPSTMNFSPGHYTFVAHNTGKVTHALELDGPGVKDETTGNIAPGGSKSLTVTLREGSYQMYCPVDDHRKLGMQMTLTVGAAGGARTGGTPAPATSSVSGGGSGY